MTTHPHLEGLIPVAVDAFLGSTGQAHTVTQLQRDLTTTCMRAALEAALAAPPAEAPGELASVIDSMERDAVDIRLGRQWMSACEHYLPKLRRLAAAPAAPAEGDFRDWFARAFPNTEMEANDGIAQACAERSLARSAWCAGIALADSAPRVTGGRDARPLDEWHEDFGPVVWWKFPIDEPAWIGGPNDSDWPGYHTHWTPHPDIPALQAATGGADHD